MSYYKFTEDDLFVNTLKTYPDVDFYIQSGSVYINNETNISGTYSDNIKGVPVGFISLYEYNINRATNQTIYPFVTKDGFKNTFKTINKKDWNTQYGYGGDQITSSYNLSASITRYFVNSTTDTDYRRLQALKNTVNHYAYLSPRYDFETYYSTPSSNINAVNMITIPSIFYGSSIKKGSVNLKWYVSGTLAAQASDSRFNGDLVQVSGSTTGGVVGSILYNEGVILLTASAELDSTSIANLVDNSTAGTPRWIYFGRGANDGLTPTDVQLTTLSASFGIEFQGTNDIQTVTMLAKAPYNELNHSNNPTYLKDTNVTRRFITKATSSYMYTEPNMEIANVVHSPFTGSTPPFQKETYISKVALYDEDKNLIGYAKLATPVRKTEDREFLFKLKLDI
tara:strand:- start:2648 stop:3835 length:1188 start_codon:yes stop_codon:yes gene_type:complete